MEPANRTHQCDTNILNEIWSPGKSGEAKKFIGHLIGLFADSISLKISHFNKVTMIKGVSNE